MLRNRPLPRRRPALWRALAFGAKAVIPLLVLAAGAALVFWMMQTAPKAERTQRPRQARLVEVVPVERQDRQVIVRAQGTVRPAREVVIRPQVDGEVIAVSEKLEPGGRFERGEQLVEIDPRDFELAVQIARSDLDRAEADLAIEMGNQKVAEREYELLGKELSDQEKALVLREPQLATARAAVARAEAELADALLDLERTRVTAPFDALVVTESADVGTKFTSTQAEIATLIGTDTFWVELAVPQDDLKWIRLPYGDRPGARVSLRQPKVWNAGATREGRVVRLLSDLSQQGRMARLLVAVDDPLALEPDNRDKPRLIVGQYLQAEIVGRVVENAVALDRRFLRQGDRVWVMNSESRLEVRPVSIAHRGAERVVVTAGIESGERIVATDIATASEGMPLRLDGDTAGQVAADGRPPAEGTP